MPVAVAPALCCLKTLPAGEESRDARGEADVDVERDAESEELLLMPDRGVKEEGLESPFTAGCEVDAALLSCSAACRPPAGRDEEADEPRVSVMVAGCVGRSLGEATCVVECVGWGWRFVGRRQNGA